MSYYFRISVIKYIYWYVVTADGFQNGCQIQHELDVGLEVFQMTDQIPI